MFAKIKKKTRFYAHFVILRCISNFPLKFKAINSTPYVLKDSENRPLVKMPSLIWLIQAELISHTD